MVFSGFSYGFLCDFWGTSEGLMRVCCSFLMVLLMVSSS
jgi:hypothetical protein